MVLQDVYLDGNVMYHGLDASINVVRSNREGNHSHIGSTRWLSWWKVNDLI